MFQRTIGLTTAIGAAGTGRAVPLPIRNMWYQLGFMNALFAGQWKRLASKGFSI